MMSKKEYRLSKLNVIAAWFGVFAGLLGLLLHYWEYRTGLRDKAESRKEIIKINTARVEHDYPTILSRYSISPLRDPKGIIHVYWEVSLINNSQVDVTIESYRLDVIEGLPFDYDRGIFSSNLKTCSQNISISPGRSTSFYIKSILLMPWKSLEIAQEKFGSEPTQIDSIYSFFDYLYSKDIDCLGNELHMPPGSNKKTFISDDILNQKLKLTIETGRGTVLEDTLVWYKSNKD